jgi:D-alanyl-D-alanine carboxypeptidase (penicillin-binding protein 5/6)
VGIENLVVFAITSVNYGGNLMKKLVTILIAAFVLTVNSAVFAAPPEISAPSAILIDSETGRVLYEKNADAKMYPASTTKIMTALLAIEHGNLDDKVTATNNVVKIERGSSQIYIEPGEILTLRQLLYALLLESANDAAIAIAEHISGSVDEFAALMNEKAKSLGAVNSHFVNPNGLHNENHYTTSRDLAIIAREAMKSPVFREIVGTYHYEIPETNKKEARNYITNSNKMIWKVNNKYKYEPAIGIKTGYTSVAQHCLVGGAAKDGLELIAVGLGNNKDAMYPDVISLFEYGFSNFKKLELMKKNTIVTTINIENGDRKLNLLATEDYSITGSEDELAQLQNSKEIILKEAVKAPVAKGDVLGTVVFTIDGIAKKSINLVAEEDVLSTRLVDKAAEAYKKINWWKVVLILIALFLIWRTIVTYIKLKRRKRGLYLSKKRRY